MISLPRFLPFASIFVAATLLFSGCEKTSTGWRGDLEVHARGKTVSLVKGDLFARPDGALLFNVAFKGHELSIIDLPHESQTLVLIHLMRNYMKAKPDEIESATLYRCRPGDVNSCLARRGYRKVGDEVIEGHPCEILEGKTSYEGRFGVERIWRPTDLPEIYWLKAIAGLSGDLVIESSLKNIREEKMASSLFEMPTGYTQMNLH